MQVGLGQTSFWDERNGNWWASSVTKGLVIREMAQRLVFSAPELSEGGRGGSYKFMLL